MSWLTVVLKKYKSNFHLMVAINIKHISLSQYEKKCFNVTRNSKYYLLVLQGYHFGQQNGLHRHH